MKPSTAVNAHAELRKIRLGANDSIQWVHRKAAKATHAASIDQIIPSVLKAGPNVVPIRPRYPSAPSRRYLVNHFLHRHCRLTLLRWRPLQLNARSLIRPIPPTETSNEGIPGTKAGTGSGARRASHPVT